MLLEINGLVEDWENDGKSDNEGEWSHNSRETLINNLPPSIRERFLQDDSSDLFAIDFSGVGRSIYFLFGKDDGNGIHVDSFIPDRKDYSIVNVSGLKMNYFRRKLVEIFPLDFL